MKEQVMHIPREAVEGLSGYEPEVEPYRLLGEVEPEFHTEDRVEGWYNRVEVVAYTIVAHDNQVLVGERLDGAGEGRLHGERFLGWGGHLNSKDAWWANESGVDWEMVTSRGAFREASEELDWVSHGWPQGHFHKRGFIYSEADDVSTDHVGIVSLLRVSGAHVRETDKYQGTWHIADRLTTMGHPEPLDFEEWSKLIIPEIDKFFTPKVQW